MTLLDYFRDLVRALSVADRRTLKLAVQHGPQCYAATAGTVTMTAAGGDSAVLIAGEGTLVGTLQEVLSRAPLELGHMPVRIGLESQEVIVADDFSFYALGLNGDMTINLSGEPTHLIIGQIKYEGGD